MFGVLERRMTGFLSGKNPIHLLLHIFIIYPDQKKK